MSIAEIRPESETELARFVEGAMADSMPLEILGGGTRRGLGRPVQAGATLSTTGLSGITAYDPAELVMSARAGTPLSEVVAELDRNGQMLAFEPMDHRILTGSSGEPTIGGVFAANVSGPRRIAAGAARDSLLGVRFVNGRGEVVVSGGRVMKNVTGLDLVKLLSGSWGTLGVLTEVTFKVLPKPQAAATIVVAGLNDAEAAAAMSHAMALTVEVSGAAHLPETVVGAFLGGALRGAPATVLRIEGLAESVAVRSGKLAGAMERFGPVRVLDAAETAALWRAVADVVPFAARPEKPVWRVSVAPSAGHQLVAALRLQAAIDAFYDWQGGLVWLATEQDPEAELIRAYVKGVGGGHATLLRADPGVRAAVPVFEPQAPALAELAKRIKRQFDPAGILNPGRIYADI